MKICENFLNNDKKSKKDTKDKSNWTEAEWNGSADDLQTSIEL